MSKKLYFLLLLSPLPLCSIEFLKDYLHYNEERPFPTIANDLIYGDGSTELTSQINEYETITANKPIKGSIFVTHDARNAIDTGSFRLGNKPLKVTLVQSTRLSSSSPIMITIYSFQLDGMPAGTHTLPPISVKVADKVVQALPLSIEVSL